MAEGDNSYFRSLHSWWREGHKRHKNMYLANGPIYMLHTTRLVCTMQTWCHYIWSSEIPSVITVALLAYYSSQRQPVAHILECEKLEVPPADFFFPQRMMYSPYVYCLGHLHSRKSRLRKLLFWVRSLLRGTRSDIWCCPCSLFYYTKRFHAWIDCAVGAVVSV